jgi:hypothetical protein
VHIWPPSQALPQKPQWLSSLLVLTQLASQHRELPAQAGPPPQPQLPPVQDSPSPQPIPQPPQCAVLSRTLMHVPPQHSSLIVLQTIPQRPQFDSSPLNVRQPPPQHSWPPVHTAPAPTAPLVPLHEQRPPTHVSFGPQRAPQAPQFWVSVARAISQPLLLVPSQFS